MKHFLFIFFLVGSMCACAPAANAQTPSVPLKESYDIQQTFAVDILMDSEGQSINALEVYIFYSDETLRIVNVEPGNSAIDVWVSEPRVDVEKHEIVLIGGIAGGAVLKDAPLATLVIQTIAAGEASLQLDTTRSGVYLSDGQGTRISVAEFDTRAMVSTTTYQPSIRITSSTHPEEFLWYANPTAILAWEAGENTDWSYTMSLDPTDIVDTTADQPIGQVQFSNLSDGVHYFQLHQHLGGSDWSDPVMRGVRVDTTAPVAFTVTKHIHDPLYGNNTVLVFQTTDATSGVAYYEVSENSDTYRADRGPVVMRNPNASIIRVTAYDYAGNATSAEIKDVQTTSWTLILFICIGLAILLVFLFLASSKKIPKNRSDMID